MAKPNYAYEKRQRDLAKKKKKEEKRLKKQGKSLSDDNAGTVNDTPPQTPETQ